MRRTTLMALLFFVCAWSQDSARGQTSTTPPVSLAPPHASPPHSAKSAKPKGGSALGTNDRTPPAAMRREPSLPVIGSAPAPNPAADYDGFSASIDDNDAPSQVTPPVRSRAAKGSDRDVNGLDAQSSIDQEDEALKRKLTICKNCK